MNDHFAAVGLSLAAKIPKTASADAIPNIDGEILDLIQYTSTAKVRNIIKSFPSHKSMGLINFSTKLVKDAAPAISEI